MTVFETVAFNHSATCPFFAPRVWQGTNNVTRFRSLCQPFSRKFHFLAFRQRANGARFFTARRFTLCYRAATATGGIKP